MDKRLEKKEPTDWGKYKDISLPDDYGIPKFMTEFPDELPNRVQCPNCGGYNTHFTYGDRLECGDCRAVFS